MVVTGEEAKRGSPSPVFIRGTWGPGGVGGGEEGQSNVTSPGAMRSLTNC